MCWRQCSSPCDLMQAIMEKEAGFLKVSAVCASGVITPASSAKTKCPRGLTPKQVILLAAILRYSDSGSSILTYDELSLAVCEFMGSGSSISRVAVRELVEKLEHKGFFNACYPARDGVVQGKRYVVSLEKCCSELLRIAGVEVLTPHPLPCPPAHPAPQSVAHPPHHSPAHPAPHPQPHQIIKKKKKEEEKAFLFLSEIFKKAAKEYLQKRWPALERHGFDFQTFQHAALVSNNKELLVETWMDSLDRAEFEIQRGYPKCKGQPVYSPRGWIFGCIKASGYYPRPPGYKTSEDLVLEAAQKEVEESRCKQAEARFEQEFRAWFSAYSGEELRSVMSFRGQGAPSISAAERYFKAYIWPKQQLASMPWSMSATEEKILRH